MSKKVSRALEDAARLLAAERHFALSDARERIAVVMSEAASPAEAFADPATRAALGAAATRLAASKRVSLETAQHRIFTAARTALSR